MDSANGRRLRDLKGHKGQVYTASFDETGETLASASDDGKIGLWNTTTFESIFLEDNDGPVFAAAIHPNGRVLASSSATGTIRLWDVPSRHPMVELQGHVEPPRKLVFSRDGKLLASMDRHRARLWNVDSRYEITSWPCNLVYPEDATAIDFHPAGTLLAACCSKGDVQLLDTITGTVVRTCVGTTTQSNRWRFTRTVAGSSLRRATARLACGMSNAVNGYYNPRAR